MMGRHTDTEAEQAARRLIPILDSLLAIPTPNPPGNEAAAAEFLEKLFAPFGLPTRRIPLAPGRESLTVVLPGRRPDSVALCGHLDTVPPAAERWTYPPFEATIRDQRIYGLGAADMKGGVACIADAALDLLESGTKTDHTIILAFTADEEGHMGGARSLVTAGVFAQTKFLVIAEPTDGRVYVGEKGQLWLRIAFKGLATHGSTPSLGRNAVLAAAEAALHLEKRATTKARDGEVTLNVGRLAGGERVNAVPEYAELDLDVRFAEPSQGDTLLKEVQELAHEVEVARQVTATLTVLRHLPPLRTDAADVYLQTLTTAVSTTLGRGLQADLAPYATDAKVIVPQIHIPFAIFGPGSIAQAHGPDEYVSLPSLVQTKLALVSFLREL